MAWASVAAQGARRTAAREPTRTTGRCQRILPTAPKVRASPAHPTMCLPRPAPWSLPGSRVIPTAALRAAHRAMPAVAARISILQATMRTRAVAAGPTAVAAASGVSAGVQRLLTPPRTTGVALLHLLRPRIPAAAPEGFGGGGG